MEKLASDNKRVVTIWDGGALFMWITLLMLGLFSEAAYEELRELGHVVTQHALINSPWFITLACSCFFGWFAYQRCLECNDAEHEAFGKSIQIVILSLAAFIPLPVEQLPLYLAIPIAFYRRLILAVILAKILAWGYLTSVILRYYLVSGHDVFRNMRQVFSADSPKQADSACLKIATNDEEQTE